LLVLSESENYLAQEHASENPDVALCTTQGQRSDCSEFVAFVSLSSLTKLSLSIHI